MSKLEKILDIASKAYASDKVEIWTNSYIAKGTLLKEEGKTIEGIITLIDAQIYPLFSSECYSGCENLTWLNIFEDQIISFSVLK